MNSKYSREIAMNNEKRFLKDRKCHFVDMRHHFLTRPFFRYQYFVSCLGLLVM